MNVVFILGMHRSGTSCLAGCLEARGLHLGRVSRKPGVAGNPFGTLESFRVNDLNEELLGSWLRPRLPVTGRGDVRERIAGCARVLVDEATRAGAACVGIKDPRLTLTLPFWRGHFDRVQLVGTFRNPGAVHRSLTARSPLSPFGPSRSAGLAAWKLYNRALLRLCDQERMSLISFDLQDDYIERVSDISREFDLATSVSRGRDFFQPNLRKQIVVSFLGDREAEMIYRDLEQRLSEQRLP